MEKEEIKKIEGLIEKGNYELEKLYKDHIKLEEKIKKLSNSTFLSQKEEVELKKLKERKLIEKREIFDLISKAV